MLDVQVHGPDRRARDGEDAETLESTECYTARAETSVVASYLKNDVSHVIITFWHSYRIMCR